MLSVNLIERMFSAKRYDKLLEAVAANGMELPLSLKVRLSAAPAAAVALSLTRLTGLTYGPSAASRAMLRFLIETQDANGSWDGDPLITAVAVAALAKVRQEHAHTGVAPEALLAQERGLAALATMQAEDGLFRAAADRTAEDRALTASFVLLSLGRLDDFRQAVRLADLMSWLEQRQDDLDRAAHRLWRMARLEAPAEAVSDAQAA